MKCSKCGYLGFETGDRCKNCGYDFSLAITPTPAAPELLLRDSLPIEGPFLDVPLGGPASEPAPDAGLDLDRLLGVPEPAEAFGAAAPPLVPRVEVREPAPPAVSVDAPAPRALGTPRAESRPTVAETHLPLFSTEPDDDRPLIAPPAGPPRPPVAVRRSTPAAPRWRSRRAGGRG